MHHVYSFTSKHPRTLMRVLAALVVLAIWILIDKGNVYGQSVSALTTSQTKTAELALGNRDGDPTSGQTDPNGGMVVYPNPVKEVLVFDFEFTVRGSQSADVHIVNALGQTVLRGTVSTEGGPAAMMRLDGLKPGLYMVRAVCGGKEMVKRIIKD